MCILGREEQWWDIYPSQLASSSLSDSYGHPEFHSDGPLLPPWHFRMFRLRQPREFLRSHHQSHHSLGHIPMYILEGSHQGVLWHENPQLLPRSEDLPGSTKRVTDPPERGSWLSTDKRHHRRVGTDWSPSSSCCSGLYKLHSRCFSVCQSRSKFLQTQKSNLKGTYCSPFWKSTVTSGWKNPCQRQATNPIPVAS